MSANRLPSITFRRARVPGIAAFFRFRENVTQSLLFRERGTTLGAYAVIGLVQPGIAIRWIIWYDLGLNRKSTRLNSSHLVISYAVFCLKKIIAKISQHGITALHFVPSRLQECLAADIRGCDSVRLVASSGEGLSAHLAHRFFERFGPQVELHNL